MENNFCDISVDDFVELFRNAQVMHSTKVKILKHIFNAQNIPRQQDNYLNFLDIKILMLLIYNMVYL